VHIAVCLSVADSARDGVPLYASASSEGKEWGDKTGQMKKRANRQTPQQIVSTCLFL
jgi:hypothetical protein